MELSDLGSIGEFVSLIAVLTSVVYLAFQIRQNSKKARLSNLQQLFEAHRQMMLEAMANTDLSFHQYLNSLAPDPHRLSGVDYYRIVTTELDQHAVVQHLVNYLKLKGLEFRSADAST